MWIHTWLWKRYVGDMDGQIHTGSYTDMDGRIHIYVDTYLVVEEIRREQVGPVAEGKAHEALPPAEHHAVLLVARL